MQFAQLWLFAVILVVLLEFEVMSQTPSGSSLVSCRNSPHLSLLSLPAEAQETHQTAATSTQRVDCTQRVCNYRCGAPGT